MLFGSIGVDQHPDNSTFRKSVLGLAAKKLGAAGFNAGFVPKHDKIITASRLLNHKEPQVLQHTAPTTPRDYDFLCAFPGHWLMMRGVMRVVK